MLIIWATVAWWWPGITGQDAQTDVLVVGDDSFWGAKVEIDRRLREEGLTTSWSGQRIEGCSDPLGIDGEPEVVAIALPVSWECGWERLEPWLGKVRSDIGEARLVVVVPWMDVARSEEMARDPFDGMSVIDPRSLISEEPADCLWWDECPGVGEVETVVADSLTQAGRERLARILVSGVL